MLISIIEGTTPSTKKGGAPGKFKYFSEASAVLLPDTRGFFFPLPTRLSMTGDLTVASSLPRRLRRDRSVTFVYPLAFDYETLNEIIEADHVVLSARFPDSSLWQQPTSTIESLYLGAEEIVEANVEVDADKVLVTYPFSIEFMSE